MGDLDRKNAAVPNQIVGRSEEHIADVTQIEGENCLSTRPCVTEDEQLQLDITVSTQVNLLIQLVVEQRKTNKMLAMILDCDDESLEEDLANEVQEY